jgi:ribose transport system ATP-binding protein
VSSPLLQMVGIDKSFSGTRVLRQVSLTLSAGETLGLVGENGAGKSTLMNILGGNLAPDSGHMLLVGEPFAPRNPQEATSRGVAFVHQELNLFPNLRIADNLFLNSFPIRRGSAFLENRTVEGNGTSRSRQPSPARLKPPPGLAWIDHQQARVQSRLLLEQVGLAVSPDASVETLSAGERQLVEIAKALSVDAKVLILDEPTSSLTAREAEHLYQLLRSLQAGGLSMIYISHQLSEVFRLCERTMVLRDGEVVRAEPTRDLTLNQVVTAMVGRSISQMFPVRTVKPSLETILAVKALSQPGVAKDITFDLHRREVLGIAGLMGSGRSELARMLFGLDAFQRGQILLNGQDVVRPSPRRSIRRGLAFVTEDRREEGLCLEASIAENMVLVSLPTLARGLLARIDGRQQRQSVAAMRQATRLSSSAHDEQPVKTLSGGNQQKVVLAKWLLSRPAVLILDEPTRGIDVGAKVELYHLINELAAQGAGVLIISSELEELIGLCDRILVMRSGRIRDELSRPQFDRERILRSALGGVATLAGVG